MPCCCSPQSRAGSICHSSLPRNGVEPSVGVGEHTFDGFGPEQAALLGLRRGQRVEHQIQVGTRQIFEGRVRESNPSAGRSPRAESPGEQLLSARPFRPARASAQAGSSRRVRRVVVEEGHPALQAPGHRHVVDAFDRIVDQHHGGVQRSARSTRARAGPREVPARTRAGSPHWRSSATLFDRTWVTVEKASR